MGLVKQQELRDIIIFVTHMYLYIHFELEHFFHVFTKIHSIFNLPRSIFPTTNNIIPRNFFIAKFE